MKLLRRFLDKFGKAFIPRRFSPVIHDYLLKAGVSKVPYNLFGALFYVIILLTSLLYLFLIYPNLTKLSFLNLFLITFFLWIIISIAIAVLLLLVTYFYLDIKIFKRTVSIEQQLPDFLRQISSNLKGGMTFENAMWKSINPRFEILAVETSEVMKRVMTGTNTAESLKIFSKKYNSHLLKRTIDLIISEIEGGGNISDLIDRMVKDIDKVKSLKDEINASVLGHVIMISAVVMVFSPLLFALSFHLLKTITGFLTNLAPKIGTATSASLAFSKISTTKISPEDFKMFSIIALATIALIASFIVSIIEKGNIKSGVKYIPLYVGVSITVYLIFLTVISSVFTFI